mmetsp:Transcript_16966/g.28910  ORF Transcript_16966/g.28910 Transcript_16966/m.28910 type:complete len:84 (+) Transcript_16966:376-627(+)
MRGFAVRAAPQSVDGDSSMSSRSGGPDKRAMARHLLTGARGVLTAGRKARRGEASQQQPLLPSGALSSDALVESAPGSFRGTR